MNIVDIQQSFSYTDCMCISVKKVFLIFKVMNLIMISLSAMEVPCADLEYVNNVRCKK